MPVLPPLSAWAASRLTNLLESKTQDDFDTSFKATFADDCNVTLNGQPLSLDAYRDQLRQQSAAAFGESNATVQIEEQTQIETGNQGSLSGFVGIFYTTLSDSKFLILGAPAENRATSSINLAIKPTEKNPQNPNFHFRGYFDPRRVISVNQVVAESTYHASIPASSVPKTADDSSTVDLGTALGPFGGAFGPGPVVPPKDNGPSGTVTLPPSETGAQPETLPGFGGFGVGPVIIPGETLGDSKA